LGDVLAKDTKQRKLSSKEAEGPTFNYARVEAALGKVFETNVRSLPILRARLKSFQRVELTPSSPGRGKVIRYTREHIYNWAMALTLADFGLDPEPIARLLRMNWFNEFYVPEMKKLKKASDEHLFFALMPYVIQDPLFIDRNTPFLILRGRDISGEKITKLGGRLALIDMTALKESVDAVI